MAVSSMVSDPAGARSSGVFIMQNISQGGERLKIEILGALVQCVPKKYSISID
jgi:hypothetical protein